MALLPCPECKAVISTTARTCPRCGRDLSPLGTFFCQMGFMTIVLCAVVILMKVLGR